VRTIADDWRVTSYSGLQQHGQSIAQDLMPKLDVDAAGTGSVPAEPVLTPHQFPRGASPGTFLHSLFEELDFTQPVSEEWVLKMLQSGGYDAQWQPVLPTGSALFCTRRSRSRDLAEPADRQR
jgi:exodeoxyribonuclease V beta subunit